MVDFLGFTAHALECTVLVFRTARPGTASGFCMAWSWEWDQVEFLGKLVYSIPGASRRQI